MFSTPEFKQWAATRILVEFDFPKGRNRPKVRDKEQNKRVAAKYDIPGYPTVILLDSKGNEIHRVSGYEYGTSPHKYLQELTPQKK